MLALEVLAGLASLSSRLRCHTVGPTRVWRLIVASLLRQIVALLELISLFAWREHSKLLFSGAATEAVISVFFMARPSLEGGEEVLFETKSGDHPPRHLAPKGMRQEFLQVGGSVSSLLLPFLFPVVVALLFGVIRNVLVGRVSTPGSV